MQPDFSFQTGDPIGPGAPESDGGSSIWGLLSRNPTQKTFAPDFAPKLKHGDRGTVSMATAPSGKDPNIRLAGSQFLITLGDNIDFLDGKAAIFGNVVEGFDVLEKINTAFIDDSGRPLKDIRIRHTIVLDDPIPDPSGLVAPDSSPVPTPVQLATVRIADDESIDDNVDQETLEKLRREREARAQALTLEMVGDLPFAEVKPPENVLFVCKLNPVTQDDDLELIFSRFGAILSCEVIRDQRTGDSLQYAFVEFENQKDCEQAYLKMDGVLIDDHRIHVDFSQSVSRLSDVWRNATNTKRKKQAGGFGGIAGLERKRQYRAEEARDDNRGRYGMVVNRERTGNDGNTRRERTRSPRSDKRYRDRKDDQQGRRYKARRERSRSRDSGTRHRYDDRRRDSSRDRRHDDDRDYRREWDRDRRRY